MTQVLADVYLRNGANRRVLTTPGRSVQFFGGHAAIVNHNDMPHMLQMEGALVQPRPDAMPWAPEWLARVTEIKAEPTWPEGWAVEFVNQSEFKVEGPPTDGSAPEFAYHAFQSHKTVSAPVDTVDLTSRPHGWINPDALLEEPPDPEPTPDPKPEPVPVRKTRTSRKR